MRRLLLLSGVLLACASPAQATIAFASAGAFGASTTGNSSTTFPASIAAGDGLLLCIVNKLSSTSPTTPSGWSLLGQVTGGAGADGEDSGNAVTSLYFKTAAGTETGGLTLATPSGNSMASFILRYTLTGGNTWDTSQVTTGSDNTIHTAYSVTGAANISIAANDMIVACQGRNTNTTISSGQTLTATGVTFGTVSKRADNGTSFGNNTSLALVDALASSGTSSAAPVTGATITGVGAAGSAVFVRLREVVPAAGGGLNVKRKKLAEEDVR